MTALTNQSIATSFEQVLHVDTDGGGNGKTLVPVKDGDSVTTFAIQLSTDTVCIDNPTATSATQGGILRLQSDDGTVMTSGDRLGVIEFAGAETTGAAPTITVGARIEAVTDALWSTSENGANLNFYTTDGDASQTQKMTILADGSVGIGDSTPTELLEIAGDSDPTIIIRTDTADQANSGKISFRETAGGSAGADLRYDGSANNFIIDTSDVSNALVIARTTGNVTMPSQPAFSVYPASTQDNIATGGVTVLWGTERFDKGAVLATNFFPAPVAGRYC